MSALLLSALLATAAFASPAPNGYAFCQSVSSKVAGGKQQASAYCSSYLNIPVYTTKAVRTKTVTITKGDGKCSKTLTAPAVTTTTTSTSTFIAATDTVSTTTTLTDVSTVIEATTIYNCQAPFATPGNRKRSVQAYKPAKLKCFSEYKDSKTLSSACKCLSIQPSTTTVGYKDSTSTKIATMNNYRGTATVTPTKVVSSVVTATITAVSSTTLSETVTSTTTATTTVNSVRPSDVFAVAAWKDGAAFNGHYLKTGFQETKPDPAVFVDISKKDPSPFALRSGNLVDINNFGNPHYGGIDADSPYTDPQRITFAYDRDQDLATTKLPCSIEVKDDFMCYLNCSVRANKKSSYVCADGSWYIGSDDETPPDGCEGFTPLVTFIYYQK
ncbi:hypothetical protein HII31_00662 [Pseudocercospora fuligena]|uniref:Uncharacterized protein n=1 Tax=Pseudocercospora fuligena TaxID=685502 RepID=A0A8H6RW39_9PEZI|nr:hypothetical protein HII31_00662 [Pseudocercospora fuligena]